MDDYNFYLLEGMEPMVPVGIRLGPIGAMST